METIKRYGLKMGDLGGDHSLKRSTMAGRGVPKRFIETEGRRWVKRMIRITGLFSFVLTVSMIGFAFLAWLIPGLRSKAAGEVLAVMPVCLLFVNHMGLFMEMAGDAGGKNWFARGAGLMWISLFATFLVAIVARIFTTLF